MVEEDNAVEKRVCQIFADLLPSTPNIKKTKNNNLNVEEFAELTLFEEEQDSVTSSNREGSKWCHGALVKLVLRELHNTISKKKLESKYSITQELLVELCKRFIIFTSKWQQ